MAKLDRMAIIQEKYCSGTKPLAKFLTIYIEECKLRCSFSLTSCMDLLTEFSYLTQRSEHREGSAGQACCGLPQIN